MMNYFSNRKKWMAYLILLTFVFTCIVPTNFVGGNSAAEAATNEYVYKTPSKNGYMYYERSQHGYEHKGSHGYLTALYILVGPNKTGPKLGDVYNPNGNNPFDLAYCCDYITGADYSTSYKRFNLEDSTYYGAAEAAKIRAIVTNAYPFVDDKTVWANVNNSLPAEQKLEGNMDKGQLITAIQFAIWDYANSGSAATYTCSITQRAHGPGGEGNVLHLIPELRNDSSYNWSNCSRDSYKYSAKVANNIAKIKKYFKDLDPVYASNAGNQIVISKVDYDAFKTGTNTFNVKASIQLNATIGESSNDNIVITVKDGKTTQTIPAEKTRGKSHFNVTLNDVKPGATITISVAGNQSIAKGVYFYEAQNGRDAAQSFVGVASGTTPVNVSTTIKVDDLDEGIELFKYTKIDGSTQNFPLSGAEFELWKKVGKDPNTANDILIGKNYVTDAEGKITVSFDSSDKEIEPTDYYFIETKAPDGYVLKDSGPKQVGKDGKVEVENCHNTTTNETQVSVEKVWDDDGNRDKLQPADIVVKLLANGQEVKQVTLNSANQWKGTFENLPKQINGIDVKYEVQEVNVPDGYSHKIEGNASTGFVITNTHQPAQTGLNVKKVWVDDNDRDRLQPESIQVQLYANGNAYGAPISLNEDNSWTYSFEKLPKNDNGTAIKYTVKEVKVPAGYVDTVTGDAATGFVITNTHQIDTVALQLNKVWKGDENIVAKRPTAVQFAITGYVGDQVVYPTRTVEVKANAEGTWTTTVSDLPKRSAGKVITYFVEEMVKQPFGYDVSYTVEPIGDTEVTWSVAGNNYNATTDSNKDADCIVTATNTLRTADIMLMKDYVGGTYDTIVPDDAQAAKFTLTTDEVTDAKPIELTRMGNTYKTTGSALQYGVLYTLTETLPKDSEYIAAPDKYLELTADANGALQVVEYVDKNRTPAVDENNNVIAYKVAADGYIKGLAKMGDIQNYTKDSKVDLFGTKSWVGGTTDAAVTLTLYKDGVSTNQTTTASADTEWKYEFKELPRYDENGKTFVYTVVETPIAGYTPYYGHVTTPGGITIDIVNVNDELGESPMGEIWVQKTTNTNDATTEYGFELHVTALIDNRTELGEEMEKQHDQLETELEKAQAELKAALDVRNERGAMLLAITDTNVEKRQTFVTTTSGYSYKFFITEADGVTANLAVTTGSALQAIDTIIVTPDKDQANAQWFIDALRTMKNVIAEMAENFVAGKENRAYTDALMERIIPEVQVATGSAIAFTADNLVGLYDAEVALAQAKVNYNKAEKAVFDFHAMMTSPSALTLVIDKDFNNPIHLKDPVEGKTYDVVINGKATTITFEDKHYKIPFTLVKDQRIDFYMEATSGSMVEYHIAEVDDQDADYTDITTYWDDKSLTVENVFRTIPTYLTTGTAYGYVFYNEYASGDNPNTPQTIEEEEPPTGSEDPDEPGNPDEWIPDGSVPTGGAEPDPLDELNDPDIPLGDAAATGDTNNAVPYVVLMMFAFAGLVFTRRRFN